MQILSWNSCGLGLARKKRTISKLIRDFDIKVCFLFETKLQSYLKRLVFQCNLSIESMWWQKSHQVCVAEVITTLVSSI
jgi:hypothetical protein